jgi:hypothetical protein
LWHERQERNPANDDRKALYRAAAGNALELKMLVAGREGVSV